MKHSKEYAPIAVYVYNRHEHFKQTITALQKNHLASMSELYVVSDAPSCDEHVDQVNLVREYARSIDGFKKIHLYFRDSNMGAFNSISLAEQDILERHGRIISMEDDNVTAPDFLNFINAGLDYYRDNEHVFSIAGYGHPIPSDKMTDDTVWFSYWHIPWGFGTWAHKYNKMKVQDSSWFEIKNNKKLFSSFSKYGGFIVDTAEADYAGKIKAEDARICIQMFLQQMVTVVPYQSKVKNIGLDGSGLHSKASDSQRLNVELHHGTGDFKFSPATTVDRRRAMQLNWFMLHSYRNKLIYLTRRIGIYDFLRSCRAKNRVGTDENPSF